MFWDNFSALCKERNVTPTYVAKDLGFSNAAPSHWKNGKSPTEKTLRKIADYFDVTISSLLGEEQEAPQSLPDPLPPDIAELAEICEQLQHSKAGAARLQFLLEEAQRMLEETKAYEKKLAESQQNAVNP